MFGKLKLAGKLAVCGAAAGLVLGGGLTAAVAMTAAPAASPSSANFYSQGSFVGFCVPQPGTNGVLYAETHTNFGTYGSPNEAALGNCASGHEQLVVAADPALYPLAQPSSSGGSAPTSSTGDVVTVTSSPAAPDAIVSADYTTTTPLATITAISSKGYAINAWSESGLPSGLGLTPGSGGTADITGSTAGPTGQYLVTITAGDTSDITGAVSFYLTVSAS
jgi:hypothetical protein